MGGWFFFILLIAQGFLAGSQNKPHLRALVLCDTLDDEIGRASKADDYRMQVSLRAIAAQLGIQLHLTILKGIECSVERVSRWEKSLPRYSNDVILFYYTGHGWVDSPGVQWPKLRLNASSRADSGKQYLPGVQLQTKLRQLHNRLSIILMDCCNGDIDDLWKYKLSHPLYRPVIRKRYCLPGLESLFLKTKGCITVGATHPHELAACCDSKKPLGGFFTTGLLFAIIECCKNPNATWEQVFAKTDRYATCITRGGQHVLYKRE